MKKIFLTFLLFAIFCLTVQNVIAQNGTIREISGTVEVKKPGSNSFVLAVIGEQLNQNTVISTGFRSFAVIEIGHSSMTIRPLTRLTLNEIMTANNEETLAVELQSGRVRVDVKPPAGTRSVMSVTSPSATASVRGTSFEFDTRNLFVTDGSVSFTGKRGKEVTVNTGSSGRIDNNSRAESSMETRRTRLSPLPLNPGMTSGIFRGPVRSGVPFVIGLEFE